MVAAVSDPILPGRYEVLNANLRLNGIGDPPRYFWIVRGMDGQFLVESGEDEGHWVREDELEKALANGWIRPTD